MVKLVRFLCLAWLIPFVSSAVVYFGFASNYTTGVFSAAGFENRYEAGVYRHRILGREALLRIHEFIEDYGLPALAPRSLAIMDRQGSPAFYTAYFLSNTLFLCLTCSVLFFLLDRFASAQGAATPDLVLLSLILLMTITQFVVVPYDTLSYFFLATGCGLILRRPSLAGRLALAVVVVLAALNRETAALTPAFFFAVHHRHLLRRPLRLTDQHYMLGFLLLCFAATYGALRLALGAQDSIYQSFRLAENLGNPFSMLGTAFFAAVALVLCLGGGDRRASHANGHANAMFLLAASPYVLFVLILGQPWEIRLWVPMILSMVILHTCAADGGEIAPAEATAMAQDGAREPSQGLA